jgi:hypothetical protein
MLAGPFRWQDPVKAVAIEWGATLVDEDKCRLRFLVPLQLPQCAHLVAADLVRGRLAVLQALDVLRRPNGCMA